MEGIKVTREFELTDVRLKPGQCLTVWLKQAQGDLVQVELRVTPYGRAEVYTDWVEVQSFDDWYDIPDTEDDEHVIPFSERGEAT